ncbi:MAG: hypothetical protein ACRDY0_10100 [Acidimicrobiales bacterium]
MPDLELTPLERAARHLVAHPVRPPTPVGALSSRARRRRRRVGAGALALLLGAGAAAGGLAAARGHHRPAERLRVGTSTSPVIGYPSTFLSLATTGAVIRDDKLVRYGYNLLQARSTSTGAVQQTLLRSLGEIDGVVAPDGSVLAAVDFGCRSVIERIAAGTLHVSVVRGMAGSVQAIALSPDGSQLAYLTYPGPSRRPCLPASQPSSPQPIKVSAGADAFLPNVLAVADLATGAVRTTQTETPGHPFATPSWSPDGQQISVAYLGDAQEILVMSSHSPDFASAKRIAAPAGCGLGSQAWTAGGIVAAEGCGPNSPDLSPSELVALDASGRVTERWPLPPCIDGTTSIVDAGRTHVLLLAGIGYGSGPPCGVPGPGINTYLIATLDGPSLTTLAQIPATGNGFRVTAW